VSTAVEALTRGDLGSISDDVYREGYCIVFHKQQKMHYLVFRSDSQKVAEQKFNFEAGVGLAKEEAVEDKKELYSQPSTLYIFRDGDWKMRGQGDAKLLEHKTTGEVWFVMRQEKTQKIVANHYVIPPYCELKLNDGSDKCWVWSAQDCADGDAQTEKLALHFSTPDLAGKFKEAFYNAKELNLKAKAARAEAAAGASDDANLLETDSPFNSPPPTPGPRHSNGSLNVSFTSDEQALPTTVVASQVKKTFDAAEDTDAVEDLPAAATTADNSEAQRASGTGRATEVARQCPGGHRRWLLTALFGARVAENCFSKICRKTSSDEQAQPQ
jgi:hypothetical protein